MIIAGAPSPHAPMTATGMRRHRTLPAAIIATVLGMAFGVSAPAREPDVTTSQWWLSYLGHERFGAVDSR